jgi:hypothetical protein
MHPHDQRDQQLHGIRAHIQKHMDDESAGKFKDNNWSPDRRVLERTGPGIWSRSVNQYITRRGKSLKQVILTQ